MSRSLKSQFGRCKAGDEIRRRFLKLSVDRRLLLGLQRQLRHVPQEVVQAIAPVRFVVREHVATKELAQPFARAVLT